jgi:glycosyltransferase involved in cell wall biosynthesis
MAEILKSAHMAVLPSYREGLPLSLLVPARDAEALAAALARLAQNPHIREKMGGEARRMVEERFAQPLITAQTVALYKTLVGQASA